MTKLIKVKCEDCGELFETAELPKGTTKLTKDLCSKCYAKYDPKVRRRIIEYQCVTVKGEITTKKKMNLKEMQDFVGGYIEFAGTFVVNEEDHFMNLKKLPRNCIYTQFVGNVIALIED